MFWFEHPKKSVIGWKLVIRSFVKYSNVAGCYMTNAYLLEWIRKAEEDYDAALALARQRKKSTPNAVSFHCQQCAEKYLKAFLVQQGVAFPKTHDLLELHKLCLAVKPALELVGDLLDSLNPYAVEYRYPGDEVNADEAKAAIRAVKEVRRFMRSQLGEIVNQT
jgi:HEPN domain-containing protein